MKVGTDVAADFVRGNESCAQSSMTANLELSLRHLHEAAKEKGLDHWVVMFSGGKDSTVCLILVLEAIKRGAPVKRLDVVLSDTGVEIPILNRQARRFLRQVSSPRLEVHKHIVRPDPDEAFWVLIIGKGYPPPNQHFRWCTSKLKIKPAERVTKNVLVPGRSAIITGIRFGESDARDARLRVSCSRGGECGQGVWYDRAVHLESTYLGPIVAWRECDVWDFLDFQAPIWGYDTRVLRKIYLSSKTRFGCWTCTVVRQDRTMARIIAEPSGKKLAPLKEFRDWLAVFATEDINRVKRPNGMNGRLTLAARKRILRRLRSAERRAGRRLLTAHELIRIKRLWRNPIYGDEY